MKKAKISSIPFRRKRQGRTNYKKRLKILMSGKYRLVVRKSLKNLQASIVEYSPKGDKTIFTISAKTLDKLGWKGGNGNVPSAYLIGMSAGKKALEKGISEAILDVGFNQSTKGSRLYAALAGAVDAGLKIPLNPEVLPSKDRVSGEHIAKHASVLKGDAQKYNRQFSVYLKKGLNPENIVKHFNEIRSKINA